MEYGFWDLRRSGRKAAETRTGPRTLVSMHVLYRMERSGSPFATPALLISTSSFPNFFSTKAAAAAMDFSSVTSMCIAESVLWMFGNAWSSATAASALGRERPATITWKLDEADAITFAVA